MLSKSTLMRHAQCPLSLYLHKKRPFLRDRLSAETLAKFKRGREIGKTAQKLFPGGVDLTYPARAFNKAAAKTADAIASGETTLYEAAFLHEDVLVIMDILVLTDAGWCAYEVKSGFKISDTYIFDAATQYHIITSSGLKLKDISLITRNSDVEEDDEDGLLENGFIITSVLDNVKKLEEHVEKNIAEAKEILTLTSSPKIKPGEQCTNPYSCDFIGHCTKKRYKKEKK